MCHSHMVPSTSGSQRNLQTVTTTVQEMHTDIHTGFSRGATLKNIWFQAEPEHLCFTHINYKTIFNIMEKII